MKYKHQIDAVAGMQDYIDLHYKEEILPCHLDAQTEYCCAHSELLFKKYTGYSPNRYIKSLRLSNAALELRDTDALLAEVAEKAMFESQEGFIRAFSKEFGITPGKYQVSSSSVPIPLFKPLPVRITHGHLLGKENFEESAEELEAIRKSIRMELHEYPGCHLLLKRAKKAGNFIAYIHEQGCRIWGTLWSIKNAIDEPAGIWLNKKYKSLTRSLYAQGIALPRGYKGEVPKGFELIHIPPYRMLSFRLPPSVRKFSYEAVTILHKFAETFSPIKHGLKWADEFISAYQMGFHSNKGYIEGRPVEPLSIWDEISPLLRKGETLVLPA